MNKTFMYARQCSIEWLVQFHFSWLQNFRRVYCAFLLLKGAFLWDDLDQDQLSKITRIMVHQTNRRIHSGHGFIGPFDVPWSEWSWITFPDPDHPKGTHPKFRQGEDYSEQSYFEPLTFAELRCLLEYFDLVYLHFHWVFLTLFAYIFILIKSKMRIFCWQF